MFRTIMQLIGYAGLGVFIAVALLFLLLWSSAHAYAQDPQYDMGDALGDAELSAEIIYDRLMDVEERSEKQIRCSKWNRLIEDQYNFALEVIEEFPDMADQVQPFIDNYFNDWCDPKTLKHGTRPQNDD